MTDSTLTSAPVPPSPRRRVEALTQWPAEIDVLVLGLRAESTDEFVLVADGLDEAASQEILQACIAVGACAKAGSTTRLPAVSGVCARSILVVGLGNYSAETSAASMETLRRAAGSAARAAGPKAAIFAAIDGKNAEPIALGLTLGSHSARRVTSARKDTNGEQCGRTAVLCAAGHEKLVERAGVISDSVCLARDLVNTPPNLLYPASFAKYAADLGHACGLTTEVLDENELAENGFGGIIGVGRGSARKPRLLRLSYRVNAKKRTESTPHLALVGKGVTFDTGGISIKPAAGMEKMTSDMGGAAAVIATIIAAARLGAGVDITATVPMAENMPSADAYRPGDVLTMYGGTTVEVLNTDAEGRLILADAIVRACEDNPDYLIDTATLTGAQMVALGSRTPGVLGDDDFRDSVAQLSQSVGENGWPMPIPDEIRSQIDSPVADLSNVGPNRWGGMLLAACFLREFVAESVTWAHIDVAGPAFNDSAPYGYVPKGGTGIPVRTMLAVIESLESKES